MPLIEVLQNTENARPGGEFKGLILASTVWYEIQFLLWLLRSFNIFHFILTLLMYFYWHFSFFLSVLSIIHSFYKF